MMSNGWKLPLNVAIGIHILVLLGSLYLPAMFKTKPKFADIYTVSIINISEPAANTPPAVAAPKATPPPVTSPPKKIEKAAPIVKKTPEKTIPAAVPIAEPEENINPTPVPQKTLSLKPIKKKKVKDIKLAEDIKPPDNQARKQEIERNRREILAKAIKEEELLAAKAQLAQEALEAERKLLQASQSVSNVNKVPAKSSARPNNENSTSTAASGSTNLLESQYLSSVFNRLHQFWAPPEYLQQDPNLTAIVVITINPDGNIANMLFESKSGDRVFDQFVNSTIEAANPMPPIPPALKKQRFEIGLRFRPGSIQ
jgi:TonB family protein